METASFLSTLVDPTAPPLNVLRGMMGRYGVDWLAWPYSVIKSTLGTDLLPAMRATGVDSIPEWALNRVTAMGAVALHDNFWEDWEHFHFLTQAINGNVADFRNHHELSVGEMMLAVAAANSTRAELGHLSFTPAFSEEVSKYVAAQALAAGIWYLPSPLDFAKRYAANVRYRCKDCGSDAEVVFDDGVCDTCTHRFDPAHLGAWLPDPAVLASGKGRRVEVYERNPTAPVEASVRAHISDPNKGFAQNAADICAAKLIAAAEYARVPLAVAL